MPLSFLNYCLPESLALVADGKLWLPADFRAQIKFLLELRKTMAYFFSQRSGYKRPHQEPPPPLVFMFAGYSPLVPVRIMCGCVAIACQRLATAPACMRIAYSTWVWAGLVMDRVTRGRVKRVQVRL